MITVFVFFGAQKNQGFVQQSQLPILSRIQSEILAGRSGAGLGSDTTKKMDPEPTVQKAGSGVRKKSD